MATHTATDLAPADLGVLARALEPAERQLLSVIWRSVARAEELYGAPPSWPVWDFVSRSLLTEVVEYPDPNEVFEQLPTVRRWGTPDQKYGLVWRERPNGGSPSPDEHVGPTIAGLRALGTTDIAVAEVADTLAAFVGELAKQERVLPTSPSAVAEARKGFDEFAPYVDWFAQATPARRSGIPLDVVAQTLNWEYARISILPPEDAPQVSFRGLGLQPYLRVCDAHSYLQCVAASEAAESNISTAWRSPLTLVQTIDYLAYALRAHPGWNGKSRFVHAPDLESASALGMHVTSRAEFERNVTALWNIIGGGFKMPSIPTDQITDSQQQGSVNQLHYWLEVNLGLPLSDRLSQAIEQIRSVGVLRQSWAHAADETRAATRKRQRALGLPESITDWAGAWTTLCVTLAGAFDVVRQEVQLASI